MTLLSPSQPLLTQLVDHLPVGVIVLDTDGVVVLYNSYEEILASRRRESVVGRRFFDEVAPCMNVKELGRHFVETIGRDTIDVELEFSFPLPFLKQPRDVSIRMSSFEAEGRPHGVLFIEDVSAQRAVERMKQTLSTLLVHDLKNPVAVALTNLQVLRDEVAADEDAARLADGAIGASRRLSDMIVNLLDITRLETDSMPLQRQDVELGALAREVVERTAPLASVYEVELVCDPSAHPVVGRVDADAVLRGMTNLVDNAIRYAKSRVVVRVHRENGSPVIEVADDGRGIPEPLRETIFDMYARGEGEDSVAGARSNRGMGLTFVRLMSRAHGGDVTVQCPPSGGSVFRVTL